MFGFLFGLIGLIVVAELALVALLIFVPAARKPISDVVVANRPTIQNGTNIYSIVCLLLAISAFADLSWSSGDSSDSKSSSSKNENHDHHGLIDYYQSQRNLILSLVSPILFLVIEAFADFIKSISRLEATETALKKQATNASSEYMKMVGKEGTTATPSSTPSTSVSEKSNEKISQLEQELKMKNSSLETLKRQNDELLTSNKALKDKLKDFDLLLGDAKKKED